VKGFNNFPGPVKKKKGLAYYGKPFFMVEIKGRTGYTAIAVVSFLLTVCLFF
jgi:hypothetical protein